ncbi:DUF262 domain-containing protein [Flavobacterium sp. PL12]|uniref:DUF262 domain-containing protein n=1 Tax=Flavobacterium sp. PL12 TaxID=3071718 RepID=UPI00319E49C2
MDEVSNVNELKILEINKLLNFNFFIPSYQRGYRWTDKEVNALLKDIWDFKNENHTSDKFYCLQPIVVKDKIFENESYWEVIDGQQRLTTILIILYYFNQMEFKIPKKIFTVSFETRPDSKAFLASIEDKELALTNVDYFHIHNAYNAVYNWFEAKGRENTTIAGAFYETLINVVKVIWYEIKEKDVVEEEENAIDVFTRINMGKIPLTNSELVKALFLQKKNFDEHQIYIQLKIAKEWDEIEKKLQDDAFWYFIYNSINPIKYENRIEYIFDLLKGRTEEDEEHHTFNAFVQELENNAKSRGNKKTVEESWLTIKNYFQSLEEWFSNAELYHLIGFLIEYKYDINSLREESVGISKSKFVEHLNGIIKTLFEKINIDNLDYKVNPKQVRKTLLLFNIKTIISTQEAEVRFPFDKYKKENWDIEHVNSQTYKVIEKAKRKDWALDLLEYFTGEKGYSETIVDKYNKTEMEIQDEMVSQLTDEKDKEFCKRLIIILKSEKSDDHFFQDLNSEIRNRFKENEINQDDGIANLALLDQGTNRSYKNAMFPIKRKHIIANDANGIFVPICTKNLFLKYYSNKMSDVMYWKKSDASDYLQAIKQTLSTYLPKNQ